MDFLKKDDSVHLPSSGPESIEVSLSDYCSESDRVESNKGEKINKTNKIPINLSKINFKFLCLNELTENFKISKIIKGKFHIISEDCSNKFFGYDFANNDDIEVNKIELMLRLLELDHNNIVKIAGILPDNNPSNINLILRKFPGKSINSLIVEHNSLINQNNIKKYVKEIINMLDYLHQKNIALRESLNCRNIYVSDNNEIKIFNFMYAERIQDKNKSISDCSKSKTGNIIRSKKDLNAKLNYDDFRIDKINLGNIIYKMVLGSDLEIEKVKANQEALNDISSNKFKLIESIGQTGFDLIVRCITQKIADNFTVKEILNDPFFLTNV